MYGRMIEGHVQDCNKAYLERRLKHYDKQLYLKWNPRKRSGRGVWEVRRQPDTKIPVYKTTYKGTDVYQLEYRELDIVNHVLDADYLNEGILQRIYEMDAWRTKNWVKALEASEADYRTAESEKEYKELKYQLMHEKRVLEAIREALLSGKNPMNVFSGKYK